MSKFNKETLTPLRGEVLIQKIEIKNIHDIKKEQGGVDLYRPNKEVLADFLQHPHRGKVIAVGELNKDVLVGDIVACKESFGEPIIQNADLYYLVAPHQILGIIEESKDQFDIDLKEMSEFADKVRHLDDNLKSNIIQ